MDFVTIFYNNNIDIKLLEIQAFSFKYLKENICNNIFLFFNSDNVSENIIFKNYFYNTLINIYPTNYKNRIRFYTKTDFELDCKNTWQSQQLLKLIISKYITTEYYCVLDTKVHFIKQVDINDFFDKNAKPILYYYAKTHLNNKFIGSLKLFDTKQQMNNFLNTEYYETQTICPFIFKTEYVKQLIVFIPNFYLFFLLNNDITEFFIYVSFITKINKLNDYHIKNNNEVSFIFFNHIKIISQEKILGIHHKFILNCHDKEKTTLLNYYENTELYERVRSLLNIKKSNLYII